MSSDLTVVYKNEEYPCIRYSWADEPKILDIFFFWKTAVLLAEQTQSKKPQFPEAFSERLCCLVCNLACKPGAGYNAFRLSKTGKALAAVEIKATITEQGFTDVKRDLEFDELYWLSFTDYNLLKYEIYKLTKQQLKEYVKQSKTERDRATVHLKRIADTYKLKPVRRGRIGIIKRR